MDIYSELNSAAVIKMPTFSDSSGKISFGKETLKFPVSLVLVYSGTYTSTCKYSYVTDTSTLTVSSGMFFSNRDFYS